MKRLDTLDKLESLICVLAVPVASGTASDWATKHNLGTPIRLVSMAIASIVAFVIAQYVFRSLTIKRRLIRRLVCGEEYIEGQWINAVTVGNAIVRLGRISIAWTDHGYLYTGDNYDPDTLSKTGSFTARLSENSDRVFTFTYRSMHLEDRAGLGIGELAFRADGRHQSVNAFSGYCIDSDEESSLHMIQGMRLNPKDLVSLGNPHAREKTFRRYLVELE